MGLDNSTDFPELYNYMSAEGVVIHKLSPVASTNSMLSRIDLTEDRYWPKGQDADSIEQLKTLIYYYCLKQDSNWEGRFVFSLIYFSKKIHEKHC